MNKKQVLWMVGTLGLVAAAAPVRADVTATSSVAQSERFLEWSESYERENGDRNVQVHLDAPRGFVTERTGMKGVARLDLVSGKVAIELEQMPFAVEVYFLDNRPGEGKSVLPEQGDRLIQLARIEPDAQQRGHAVRDLGPAAFRGLELDWVLVARAGQDPAASRVIVGTRHYFERLYTRQRLEREGFQVSENSRSAAAGASPASDPLPSQHLVNRGLVSQAVLDGGFVFFRETFEGNGRSCGTCHPAQNNQTIDQAFMATLPASDPLFVAEQRPASDPISQLERPALMRAFGLILENVDGLESPNEKFVMRSVPHSLSLATSIRAPFGQDTPFQDRTGWSGDGAPSPGRLREFLLGAVIQHYPKNSLERVARQDAAPGQPFDFRLPTDEELDLAAEFSLNAGRTNNITLEGVSFANPSAQNGMTLFQVGGCNLCHDNGNANIFNGENFSFDTGVELVPNPAQGFLGITFPLDGGFLGQNESSPDFDCDRDGALDCFGNGEFNTPPLVEAADTAPFFHNNVAQTVEDAVRFYTAAPFPFPIPFDEAQVTDVAAFLRVLNASFNFAIAIQRNQAALTLATSRHGSDPVPGEATPTIDKLLDLSNAEIDDAIEVLVTGPLGDLHPNATYLARQAALTNVLARIVPSQTVRRRLIQDAVTLLERASADLGTTPTYVLGEGNRVF
jgi:hypothetical protein